MNREETERQMAFILEQQAKFSANLTEHEARFSANLEKQQEREAQWRAEQQERDRLSDEREERIDRRIEQLNRSIEISRAEFRERDAQQEVAIDIVKSQLGDLTVFSALLRDAFLRLSEHAELHEQRITAIEKTLAEQAERGKETDARLDALMLVVERHIGGHEHSHHQ